jgi:hypothetical protein
LGCPRKCLRKRISRSKRFAAVLSLAALHTYYTHSFSGTVDTQVCSGQRRILPYCADVRCMAIRSWHAEKGSGQDLLYRHRLSVAFACHYTPECALTDELLHLVPLSKVVHLRPRAALDPVAQLHRCLGIPRRSRVFALGRVHDTVHRRRRRACSTRSRLGGSQRSRIETPYLLGIPRHEPQTPPNTRESCRSNARGITRVQGVHSPDGEGDVFVAPGQVMLATYTSALLANRFPPGQKGGKTR